MRGDGAIAGGRTMKPGTDACVRLMVLVTSRGRGVGVKVTWGRAELRFLASACRGTAHLLHLLNREEHPACLRRPGSAAAVSPVSHVRPFDGTSASTQLRPKVRPSRSLVPSSTARAPSPTSTGSSRHSSPRASMRVQRSRQARSPPS